MEGAAVYAEAHVSFDLKDVGYLSGRTVRCGELPNCSIVRRRKGGRATLAHPEGSCAWLGWRPQQAAAKEGATPGGTGVSEGRFPPLGKLAGAAGRRITAG